VIRVFIAEEFEKEAFSLNALFEYFWQVEILNLFTSVHTITYISTLNTG